MSTTPTTARREVPALESAYTTDKGDLVIKFEGCATKRTRRSYEYLVCFVDYAARKYDRKTDSYIALKPQVVIVKGTSQWKYADKAMDTHRYASERYTQCFVLKHVGKGQYEVVDSTKGLPMLKWTVKFAESTEGLTVTATSAWAATVKAERTYRTPVASVEVQS